MAHNVGMEVFVVVNLTNHVPETPSLGIAIIQRAYEKTVA
jgi:hypothetical protein